MALMPTFPLSRVHSSSPSCLVLLHHHFSSKTKSSPNNNLSAAAAVDTTSPATSSQSHWFRSWSNHRSSSFSRSLPNRSPDAFDYLCDEREEDEDDELLFGTSRSSGNSTMRTIVDRLRKLGYIDKNDQQKQYDYPPIRPDRGSVEDIFYAEDGVLPNTRGGLSGGLEKEEEVRFPWEKPVEKEGEGSRRKKRSKTSVAELTLPEGELRRLRRLALKIKNKTKIGGAGVTKEIVEVIHEKWRTEEVVRIKCEGPLALNMKRVHEILEMKTGGLVIWRSGTSISIYRGVTYEVPEPGKRQYSSNGVNLFKRERYHSGEMNTGSDRSCLPTPDAKKDVDSPPEIKYETVVDELLEGLGPRYTDWPGCDPLPVDADLLPGVVPGYKPPFRILPYGVRSSLGLKEGTALRRLARALPPHFALGRSRHHEGLAAAMLKLWEKSSIAKIALKRGVQLTSSERMAEVIKNLTGGILLSRNKDYLVFYRGKDFLSAEVAEALLERERLTKALQDEEEHARLQASSVVVSNIEMIEEPGTAGTLGETLEADARWANKLDEEHEYKMKRAAELARHSVLVRKLERKLFIAERKLAKAGKALAKVEEFLKPAEHTTDTESITDEERFMFRKLGLRMKAFLLLGRRGVFDGTVENMHLHWKYRELVKIIMKAKHFSEVKNVALSLEAESGGVLVSVDKISKGYAIVVFRGKDYQRPASLRPKNLLTKRKALARSIELQRHEALNHHIFNLQKKVEQLKTELDQMESIKAEGDEDLYARLDSSYSTEDEDTEDEGDEAYVESYNSTINFGSNDTEREDDAYEGEDEDQVEEHLGEELESSGNFQGAH